jgi:UDP-N-acetyl-2-amino-2-deoxyglucuronate dehydrogenase
MDHSKHFALIGAAGYIAVRHLKAIKDTGNVLLAALDKSDSVGVLDSYFPFADFFVEFERFDRHIDKLKRQGTKIEYVSICSPNYLHDSHMRFALRSNAIAICEKPLVLNPWNIDALKTIEQETEKKVYTILQLRLHPAIQALKKKIEDGPRDKIYDVDLTYITSRGHWYMISWKGDLQKSGGIATNIGVHFFDMLAWIFGPAKENIVHLSKHDKAAGFLYLERARVRWFLSIDYNDIPQKFKEKGSRTYRSINIDNNELEFSEGFAELHTHSYNEILAGRGFGLDASRSSIEMVYEIRNAQVKELQGDFHPILTSLNK